MRPCPCQGHRPRNRAALFALTDRPFLTTVPQTRQTTPTEQAIGGLEIVAGALTGARKYREVSSHVPKRSAGFGCERLPVTLSGRRFGGWTSRETYPTTGRIPREGT